MIGTDNNSEFDDSVLRPAPMPEQIIPDPRGFEFQAALPKRYRVVEMTLSREAIDSVGWLWFLWGLDIWIIGIPILKIGIAVNVVVWLLMWLALR